MAVLIGSARIDENGNAHGGAAGDQTGKEVSTQNWYLHSKGWIVLRPKSSAVAEKIAHCMEMTCANNNIGYDQYQRNTLYNAAKQYDFNTSKVTIKCETDCSAAVRVCLAYAGIMVGDFNTSSEASVILATGKFEKLVDAKYTTTSANLRRGDILVTKSKGHTVVVLSNGSNIKVSGTTTSATSASTKKSYSGKFPALPPRGYYDTGDGYKTLRLYKTQIKRIQMFLNWAISAGLTVDGQYGKNTTYAVKKFQKKVGITVDGSFGKKTLAKAKAFKK